MTQHNAQDEKDGPNIFLIFIGGSAVMVAVVLVAFIIVIALGQLRANTDRVGGVGPYNVRARQIPAASQVGQLFPTQLGNFKRTAIGGTLQDFSATYTRDKDQIKIVGSQAVSIRAAQASVAIIARGGGSTSSSNQQLGEDPSYFLSTSPKGPVRFTWSHDRWLFDVQASSQAVLDEFMDSFKY